MQVSSCQAIFHLIVYRFLKDLIRTELIFLKLTSPWALTQFMVNKTHEIQDAVNAAAKLIELTGTPGDDDNSGIHVSPAKSRLEL